MIFGIFLKQNQKYRRKIVSSKTLVDFTKEIGSKMIGKIKVLINI